MALGIVQTIIAEANADAVTTASYTITAGNNCVLMGASNGDEVNTTTHTITGTPSFTQRAIRNLGDTGQQGAASAHTHMNSAGHAAITTTITMPSDFDSGISMTITELSGGETAFTGATGEASSNSGTPSVTLTLNGDASYVFGAASDWAASGNFTAGTGETLLNTHHIAAAYSSGEWHSTSTQAAGSYTSDGAGSATRDFNCVAIEMRAAAGAASLPKPPVIISQAVNRASRY